MAKKLDPQLLDILTKYDERPEDVLWDCHGTWVAYHKAIERIAAKAGIVFDTPQVVEANGAGKCVAIAVRGVMGERSEWSFGEASPANNKNSYPYAMAEKRAKDRVVLKLIGLHGLAYSEEESDDFRPGKGDAPDYENFDGQQDGRPLNLPKRTSSASLKRDDVWKEMEADIRDCATVISLMKCRTEWSNKAIRDRWPQAWLDAAADAFDAAERDLKPKASDDDFPGDRPNGRGQIISTLQAG